MDKIARIRQEIEKKRKHLEIISQGSGLTEYDYGRLDAFRLVDSIIDFLQQESEVDLAKEIEKYYYDNFAFISSAHTPTLEILRDIAEHFYEIGMIDAAKNIINRKSDER